MMALFGGMVLCAVAPAAAAAAHGPPPPAPAAGELTCQSPALRSLPFCDRSLPISLRVADLLPRLNLTEKIGQTGMVRASRHLLAKIGSSEGPPTHAPTSCFRRH